MALLTTAEAKQFLPHLTGTGDDTLVDELVARAGALIAAHCGYPRSGANTDATIESTSYTLYTGGYEGRVLVIRDGRALQLPVAPVTAVTSIYDDPDQGYGASYLVDSGDYTTDAVDGVIRLLPDATHGGFSAAEYAVKVACTAGYTTIPRDIKNACGLIVQHLWTIRIEGTRDQVSHDGISVVSQHVAIPKEARALLAPFRLVTGWADA